jgi:hypothetical protein
MLQIPDRLKPVMHPGRLGEVQALNSTTFYDNTSLNMLPIQTNLCCFIFSYKEIIINKNMV